jgi:aspartyl-tRNA(Asn)/glutamyl-tRNA(Gln) amidotransferase subunit C
MALPADRVDSVAVLARLGLRHEERLRLGVELEAILDHVGALQAIDTSAVPETAQVGTQVNVWREDEPAASLSAAVALQNAPVRDGEYFTVGSIQE